MHPLPPAVSDARASPIGDDQLRNLAHRLRQYRFTLLVHAPGLDAAQLLRSRLMPMLSRRSGDQGMAADIAADTAGPLAGSERRASQQAETAVFVDGWQAMQQALLPAPGAQAHDARVLLVMAGLGDVLREAGSNPEADRLLETLAQVYWGLDGQHQDRPIRLLLAMDQAAWPLVETLKLRGFPVDEATETLLPGLAAAG